MALPTSIVLVLSGFALVLLGARQAWTRLPVLLAGLIMAVAFVGLGGYFTGLPAAYAWGQPIHMALLTCLSALVVVVGILGWMLAGPQKNKGVEGWLMPFVVTGGAILVVVGALAFASIRLQETTTGWVAHTERIISTVNVLSLRISQIESAVRGYVISGDKAYLDGRPIRAKEAVENLETLRVLVADDPAQTARVLELIPVVRAKIARNDAVFALCVKEDRTAAATIIANNSGLSMTKEIRRLIGEIEGEERRLLTLREAESARSAHLTRGVILLGGGITLALLATALIVVRRNAKARTSNSALPPGFSTTSAGNTATCATSPPVPVAAGAFAASPAFASFVPTQ